MKIIILNKNEFHYFQEIANVYDNTTIDYKFPYLIQHICKYIDNCNVHTWIKLMFSEFDKYDKQDHIIINNIKLNYCLIFQTIMHKFNLNLIQIIDEICKLFNWDVIYLYEQYEQEEINKKINVFKYKQEEQKNNKFKINKKIIDLMKNKQCDDDDNNDDIYENTWKIIKDHYLKELIIYNLIESKNEGSYIYTSVLQQIFSNIMWIAKNFQPEKQKENMFEYKQNGGTWVFYWWLYLLKYVHIMSNLKECDINTMINEIKLK